MRAAPAVALVALLGTTTSAAAVCSVFDGRPCAPSVCSVFDGEPCQPDHGFPLGQGLVLTVRSLNQETGERGPDGQRPGGPLNTLNDLFAALRACWVPPPLAEARPGMEISVRLSFTRKGEIMGEPLFTFVTAGVSAEHRGIYQRAVAAALSRCAPLPLTDGLGGAIAGRPISIRFIDQRNQRGAGARP
jgi:hypothetical protein